MQFWQMYFFCRFIIGFTEQIKISSVTITSRRAIHMMKDYVGIIFSGTLFSGKNWKMTWLGIEAFRLSLAITTVTTGP